MKKFITLLFSATILFSVRVQGQDVQKGAPGMWPAFIKYSGASPAFSRTAISTVDNAGKAAILTNGVIEHSEKDNRGFEHYRYRQYFNGIAIENATMVVHVLNGKIKSENGKWIKDFPVSLQTRASLTEANALTKALQNVGAQQYKWQLPAAEAFLKREQKDPNASFYPKGTLVYYNGEKDVVPSALKLAWKFDIYAQSPLSRQIIFVDASNGNILGKRELIHETNTPGTAVTGFSGSQNIVTDFNGSSYRLRETTRGNGVNTYNMQQGISYSTAIDFADADNSWNNVNAAQDQYATDAHWGAEKTYDYYLTTFGRNSIDNNGFQLNSYVHYDVSYANAYWDGNRMTYGDGNSGYGNKPFTSLDVCGHEITHGVTEHSSGLNYSYESGAMNEGFSDIFGTAIEAFARPTNNDWLMGGDFYTIRSMSNPNAYNQPDTYEGNFWYNGFSDNGGVHTNSGVLNYWFYLLTTGGSGINDHGMAYNVTGIGMAKAAAIAYRLNAYYLISTSDYYAARTFGIQAAEDLYGIGSAEAIQTDNAFTAVGLYAASCSTVTGLSASAILDMSATLNWDAIVSATSYKVQFKASNSSTWSTATTVTNNTLNLGGLTASTQYDWRVRPNCNGQYSVGQFTTAAPICNAPTGINFTAGSTSTTLTWNAAWYAVSYTVEYKLATGNTWIVAGNPTVSTFTLTGLSNPVNYDCRIKTNCSFGGSGYVQFQFTTTSTPCNAPTGLAFTYSNDISTFTWDAMPGAVSYSFYIGWAGGPFSSQPYDVTTTNSYALANLMQGGNFQFRVVTNCSGGASLPSSTFLFTTPCSMPGSLSATNITTTGATLNWIPAVGNNNNTAFEITYRLANTNNAWTSLGTTTASTKNVSGLTAGTAYDWRVRKLCSSLNSPYATAQFTTAGAQTPCSTPIGLTSSGITATQATISWTAVSGAINYSVQYKPAGSSTWSSSVNSSATSVVITGLSSSTVYDWQVRTNCSVNASSFAGAQFITPCSTPTGLSSTGITAAQATVSWSAVSGAVSYSVQYKAASSSTWSTAVSTSATNRVITGLSASTLYDWRVMTNCNVNGSAYSSAQFTTSTGSCPVPTGVVLTYVTNTSALIEWSAVGNANSYRLQYKTAAASSWTVVSNINANLYTITGLQMNTVYQYAVSSKCASTFTAYSPVGTFTTLNCVTSANNTAQWIDLFKVGTINRVSGADPGGHINTGLSTNLVIGSTNAGQISAGFSGAAASNNYCVYIDFNRNGGYESNERVVGSSLITTAGTIGFNLTIPATATPGATGLRVIMRKNTDGPISPCMEGFVGEAEDYTVNLSATAFQGIGENEFTFADVRKVETAAIISQDITVSPNPSSGIFMITLPAISGEFNYELLNMNGSVIQKNNSVNTKQFKIDISNMSAGLYLLRVKDGSGKVYLQKLQKL